MSEGKFGAEAGGSGKECVQTEMATADTGMAEREQQAAAVEKNGCSSKQQQEKHSAVPSAIDVDRLLASGISVSQIREKVVVDSEKQGQGEAGYTFSCGVCRNKLFNDLPAVNKHITLNDFHTRKIEEAYVEGFLHRSLKMTPAQFDACSRLVEDIYQHHSAVVSDQIAVRHSIAKELEKIVKTVLPDVIVRLFGSSVTQFVLNSSNVNLDLNIGDPETNQVQKRIPAVMKTCLATLQHNAGPFYEVKEEFYSALKVPHIAFKHQESGLTCELRAATAKPIELASILRLYGGLDSRAVKLGVAFKYWAKVHKLDQQTHGHYAPHIFVMMVLHYLQQVQVLPVLHELAADEVNKPEVGEAQEEEESADKTTPDITIAQLSSATGQWTTKNTQSVGELWIGLLKYYAAEFSFGARAVTIRQLAPLLRKDRDWGSARIAVEDPTITRNNVARGANSDLIFEYLMFCLKRTACYFMQLQGRLQWLFSHSPSLPAYHLLVKLFSLSEEACTPTNKRETVSVSKDVAVATVDKDKEQDGDDEESGEESETPPLADGNTSLADPETSPPDAKTQVVAKKSKKTASLGGWKKTAKKITEQLCDIELTQSPVYSLKDSFMHKKNVPYACLLCRRNTHLAPKCPDELLPRLIKEPLPPHPSYVEKLATTFHRYVKEIAPTDKELRERYELRDCIQRDIQKIFPKATLELFGSSANGFGSFDSDVDLCLILNEEYTCEKAEIILQVAKELKKKKVYIKIQPITSARVPIVKFVATKWKIECDVSLENILALHNTRLLAMYGNIDSRVRTLGYVVKHFAKVCDMCDAATGSLSSYAYILMLIHFLQRTQPPILPVLQELHDGSRNDQAVPVDQWNCYYFQPKNQNELMKVWKPKEINRLPPGFLWLEFLWYFVQHFDWTSQVVTIRQLSPLSKFDKLWQVKSMCIEDPFNLDHNLAQAVSTRMRIYILMRFKKAYLRHCEERPWKDIAHVMDRNALCGDFRAPKFIICDFCNYRGHRSAECPRKANGEAEKRASGQDDKNGGKHRAPETKPKAKPIHKVKPTPEQQEKQSVVETDGSEAGLEKKPVTEKDITSSHDQKSSSEAMTTLQTMLKASSIDDDTGPPPEVLKRGKKKATAKAEEDDEVEKMPSRAEIKKALMEQCHGSVEEAKKLLSELNKKAYCKGATNFDRKRYSVMSNVYRKMQKEPAAEKEDRPVVKQAVSLKQPLERTAATAKSAKQSQKTQRTQKPVTVIVQPNKKTDSILQQTAKQLQKHKEEDAKKQLQSKAARQAKHQNESQVLPPHQNESPVPPLHQNDSSSSLPFHGVPLVTAIAPPPSLLGAPPVQHKTPFHSIVPPVPHNTPQQLTGVEPSRTPPSPAGSLKHSTSPSGSPHTPPSPFLASFLPQTPPSPLTAYQHHRAPLLQNPSLPASASAIQQQAAYYPGLFPTGVPAKSHPPAASGTLLQPDGVPPRPPAFPVGAFPTPVDPSTAAMPFPVLSYGQPYPSQAMPAPPLMATPYQPRATTGLPLANPYPSQPIAYAAQPMTSYAGQPMTSYAGQPMTSYAGQPVMTTYTVTPFISQPLDPNKNS